MPPRNRRPLNGADVEGESAVAIQQQIRDLDAKVEDIRSSVATMAIAQATATGEQHVLAAKLDGFKDNIEDRIEALEMQRSRNEWQSWAERFGFTLVGAGGVELLRRIFGG